MDSLQHKVLEFELPPDDFNPDFIPENGIQYLQQVVYERNKCPAVVVKPIQNTQSTVDNSTSLWQEIKNVSSSYYSVCSEIN